MNIQPDIQATPNPDQLRAQAMLGTMQRQRDSAANEAVNLAGDLAVALTKLKAAEDELAALKGTPAP